MPKCLTDKRLGYQHGRNGNASKYPNNANYMDGFKRGESTLARELDATRPLDDMRPGGTNDSLDCA